MSRIESLLGLKKTKRITENKLKRKSVSAKSRQIGNGLVQHASQLYAKGNLDQSLSTLEEAIKLIPHDFRPYYIAALVQEEKTNLEKALNGFFVAGILSNGQALSSNKFIWDKVYNLATKLEDESKMILAIDKLNRREPSEKFLKKKLSILKKQKKKYQVICCKIELFQFYGVDETIFNQFEHINHIISLHHISNRLIKTVIKNSATHTESFLKNTLITLYRAKLYPQLISVYNDYYLPVAKDVNNQIKIIYLTSNLKTMLQSVIENSLQCNRDYNLNNDHLSIDARDANTSLIQPIDDSNKVNKNTLSKLDDLNNTINNKQIADMCAGTLISQGNKLKDSINYKSSSDDSSSEYTDINSLKDINEDFQKSSMDLDSSFYTKIFRSTESQYSRLMNDTEFWNDDISNVYIIDLINCYRQMKNFEKSIDICKISLSFKPDLEKRMLLGDLTFENGNCIEALKIFTDILYDNPTSLEPKSKLHQIYTSLGNEVIANQFKITSDVFLFSSGLERKDKYRWSNDKCNAMHKLFEEANEKLKSSEIPYHTATEALIDDFFCNEFITIRNDRFRSFLNRHENPKNVSVVTEVMNNSSGMEIRQQGNETGICIYNNHIDREDAKRIIRVSSLHGLDVEEWFFVISQTVISLMCSEENERASELILKSIKLYIFRIEKYMIHLFLLGVKLSLIIHDENLLIDLIRFIIQPVGYSVINFMNFLLNFFIDFEKNKKFALLMKNVQRIHQRRSNEKLLEHNASRKSFEQSRGDSNVNILNYPETKTCKGLTDVESLSNKHDNNLDWQDEGISMEHECLEDSSANQNMLLHSSDCLKESNFANSYIPRSIFTSTVDDLIRYFQGKDFITCTIMGSIMICHTRCRVLQDKEKYARLGFKYLKSIDAEDMSQYISTVHESHLTTEELSVKYLEEIKNYNIGKAYHFLGYLGLAEKHYLLALDSGDDVLRRMVIFNLSLIFKRNKSRQFLEHILSKW